MVKKIFLSAIILFSLVCFSLESLAQEDRLFEIKAKRFEYNPNIIKVNKGDRVRIRLISEDVTHGFYLDGYGLETKTHPGQDGSLVFIAEKAGRFAFRCSVTCGEFHPYMVGYLVVEPNLRFYAFGLLTFVIAIGSVLLIFRRRSQ